MLERLIAILRSSCAGAPLRVISSVLLGVLVGLGAYYALRRFFNKRERVYGWIAGVFTALVVFHLASAAVVPELHFADAFFKSFQAFFVETDFNLVTQKAEMWEKAYLLVLYFLAPVLTLSAILSTLREYISLMRLNIRKLIGVADIYVFSEMNEKSIALATDIYKARKPWAFDEEGKPCEKGRFKRKRKYRKSGATDNKQKKAVFYFCDVYKDNTENFYELKEKADLLGAICLRRDVASVKFRIMHKRTKRKVKYFLIGADENENINQAVSILNKCYKAEKEKKQKVVKDDMYLFTTFENAYNVISDSNSFPDICVRVKNEVEAFILNHAYLYAEKILRSAKPVAIDNEGHEIQELNALIVGLGKHGREMLKLLVWLSQVEGYRVNITAFDKNEMAESVLKAECPALLDGDLNSFHSPLGTKYHIKVLCGKKYAVETEDFFSALGQAFQTRLPDYVFVSLGDDNINIATADSLNRYFKQNSFSNKQWKTTVEGKNYNVGCIDAVVYNNALNSNFSKERQAAQDNIHLVGCIDETYSMSVIINSGMEEMALKIHREIYGGGEADFWSSHYSYRSSVATVLFALARIRMFADGAFSDSEDEKKKHIEHYLPLLDAGVQRLYEKLTTKKDEKEGEKKNDIEQRMSLFTVLVEHTRWNAYMLTEGFVYAEEKDTTLGKTHHLIRLFKSEKEMNKDNDPSPIYEALRTMLSQKEPAPKQPDK